MKNWSKKIASVALATLFFGFSSGYCRENNLDSQDPEVSEAVTRPLYNKDEKSNFIFDFMRSSQLLGAVESFCLNNNEEEDGKNNEDEKSEDESFPFRKLYLQLKGKLSMLVEAEKELAASNLDPKLAELETQFDAISSPKTKQQLRQVLGDLSEYKEVEYQNVIDSQSLVLAESYDLHQLSNVLSTVNDKNQQLEFLNKIHTHLLTKYEKFIARNEAALDKLEEIADNDFIIKVQNCVDYEGERLCIGKVTERPIKTLSELALNSQANVIPEIEEMAEYMSDLIREFSCFWEGECAKANEELNENCGAFNKDYVDAKDAIKEAYAEIKPVVKDAYADIKASVKEAYSEVKPAVKEAYSEVKPSIKEATSNFKTTVKESYTKVKDSIKNTAKKLFKKKK